MATIDGSLVTLATLHAGHLKSNAGISRTQLAQVPNLITSISAFDWRVWDSGAVLPTTPANDDLGLIPGTWGTDNIVVGTEDLKTAGSTNKYAAAHVRIPDNYEDGETITMRLSCGMDTTIADTSATIDVEVYKVGSDGSAGSDLYAGASTSMNSLTAADKDFVITSTGLVKGDILEVRVTMEINDAASGTAVIGKLYRTRVLFDGQG